MKRIRPSRISVAVLAVLAAAGGGRTARAGDDLYMRAWYIQYVPEGESALYGDCAFYEFPGEDGILDTEDDRNLLMDGGRSGFAYDVLLPFLRERIGTDGIVWNMSVSSPGADHYGGLQAVADNFPVASYFENTIWPEGDKPDYDTLIATLEAKGTDIYTYDAGDWLSGTETTVGDGWDPRIGARVLCANSDEPWDGADDNYWAGVIQIRCGQSVFLTGGDADGNHQEYWLVNETAPHSYAGASAELADTDVYKFHHHGSKYSSYQDFMDIVSPRYGVVPVAYGYGAGSHSHPTREALDRVWSAGGVVYRVDLDGTVLVKCDDRGNFDITRSRAYVDETETPGGSSDMVYPPPAVPAGLEVESVGDETVTLIWEEDTSVYSYDVFRSDVSGGDSGAGLHANPGCEATGIYEKVNPGLVTEPGFTDTGLTPGRTYYYRVACRQIYTESYYQTCYESRYSNEVSALTTGGKTPSPTPYGYKTPSPTPSATPSTSPTPTTTPTVTPTPSATPTTTPSATPSPSPTARLGAVVINEILADPPYWGAGDANRDGEVSSWQDEFVELVNRTGLPVELGGATISDNASERFTFPDGFSLEAGAAVVVFGGGTPTGAFGEATVFTVGTEYGLWLTNGGDTVILELDGEVLDSVTYGEEGGMDQSLTRCPDEDGGFLLHTLAAGDEDS
ncbi:MAG TPA: lamin tail domain-containing protein, partial [bacterium]|nr:lamin tail domain-containing protein [bacterium]